MNETANRKVRLSRLLSDLSFVKREIERETDASVIFYLRNRYKQIYKRILSEKRVPPTVKDENGIDSDSLYFFLTSINQKNAPVYINSVDHLLKTAHLVLDDEDNVGSIILSTQY